MKKHSVKSLIRDNRYVLLSALLAGMIFVIACAARHIFPFGPKSILRVDLFHQYAPFLEEMRSRVLSGESLVYSWESGLGKDFISQTAYYTTSPVNLLIFLFPQKMLQEAVLLFILIKICFCAGSFSAFLKAHFGRNDLSVTVFGLLYAFCAFVTCYYWNIMWMDTVALFPLVVLGLERLVRERKVLTYYLALTLTMIVNFYLAVLVCILISLYFLTYTFGVYTWREHSDEMIGAFLRFALISVLCALSSMFILAPVASALSQTEVSGQTMPGFALYPGFWQLLSAHFLGARAAVLARNEDMPNVYTGVLTLMLLPLYFTDRSIPKREKLLLGALPVFMLLCACIKPLDFLIHGMHFPANLPHRFTFVYSFVLLLMAYRAFLHLRTASLRTLAAAALFYAAGVLVSEFVVLRFVDKIDRVLSQTDLLLNAGLMILYLALFALAIGKFRKTGVLPGFFVPALLLAVIGECQFSMIQNLDDLGNRDEYIRYMDDTAEAVSRMEAADGENFARAEFRRFTTINDGALYHYHGFSQFSSLAPGDTSALVGALGIAATGNSFRYYDPTPLIDAVFDVKYVMTKDEPYPKEGRYTLWDEAGSVRIYRNERVLPLAFGVSEDILDLQVTDTQPFALQNAFIEKAAGVEEPMLTDLPAQSVTTENMEVTEKSGPADFSYTLTYPDSLEKEPSVHVEYRSDKDQYVYIYVDAGNAGRFVYANYTVKEDRELSAGKSLIDVGHVVAGEPIVCDFKLTKRGEFEKVYRPDGDVRIYCASYDDAVFQKAFDRMSRDPFVITEFEDTYVEGTVDMTDDGVLLSSIPYTAGWSVLVDGEPAEKLGIGEGGLLGVRLGAGAHTVIFRYRPPFFVLSLVITAAGIALFVLCYRRLRRDERDAALAFPSLPETEEVHDRFHRKQKQS